MVVSHYGYPIEFACDGKDCGFIFETETTSWTIAIRMIKKHLWTIRSHVETSHQGLVKIRVYEHFCGDCNGKNKVNSRGLPLFDKVN